MTAFRTVALVALLVGIACPTLAGDVFYGCSKDAKSKVRASSIRVNMTPVCRSTETLRTWNETGQQGPAGPSDAFAAYGSDTPIPSGGTFLSLAQLSLDAGSYVITGKASLSNENAAITAIPYCAIVVGTGVGGLNDQTIATIDGVGTVALSALLPTTLAAPDVVQFRCTNNTNAGADGDVTAKMITMVAVRVGTLTQQ
jgi:hypothetical protein